MSTAASPSTFSRGGALALVAGGFALFLALLYLLGAGEDFGGSKGEGKAHAASNGLNGYSGLVTLVEAQGYTVTRSRSPANLRTNALLVITPGLFVEAEEIGELLGNRRSAGPTLVIMPKWLASKPPANLPRAARSKFRRGWVMLGAAEPSGWPEELPAPYRFVHKAFPELAAPAPEAKPAAGAAAKPAPPRPAGRWRGMGLSGELPAPRTLYAETGKGHEPLVTDSAGRVLAFGIGFAAREEPKTEAQVEADIYMPRVEPVIFVAEADIANNYGLADPARAAAAVALVNKLAVAGEVDEVVFDMTLAGFGASENLLTLAFRPPFLAATLSLLMALLIIGWRAFQRFGPAASGNGPDIAFGKRQLIANGASLIIRARRFALLGKPYAALSARRIAERLGLTRAADADAIDAALARRLPDEEPFTRRAARLEAAVKPADIVAAVRSLDELATKLQQGQPLR